MVMTRKDFKAIAEVINNRTDVGETSTIDSHSLIMGLVHEFANMYPHFHGLKFFEAASARQLEWKEEQKKQRESTLSWSERYYPDKTPEQHGLNNMWMRNALASLTDEGMLFVPDIGRAFNKQGEEINMGGLRTWQISR